MGAELHPVLEDELLFILIFVDVEFGLGVDDLQFVLDVDFVIPPHPHEAFVLLGEQTHAM